MDARLWTPDGPGWVAFEGVYILFVVLILAVYAAAAGAMAEALFGLWPWVGTLALCAYLGYRVHLRPDWEFALCRRWQDASMTIWTPPDMTGSA